MARYSETHILSKSVDAVALSCRGAFAALNWKVMDDRGTSFFARERAGLNVLFSGPAIKAAIFLRKKGTERTEFEMTLSTFGIGPYPKYRLRKMSDRLIDAMERAAQ